MLARQTRPRRRRAHPDVDDAFLAGLVGEFRTHPPKPALCLIEMVGVAPTLGRHRYRPSAPSIRRHAFPRGDRSNRCERLRSQASWSRRPCAVGEAAAGDRLGTSYSPSAGARRGGRTQVLPTQRLSHRRRSSGAPDHFSAQAGGGLGSAGAAPLLWKGEARGRSRHACSSRIAITRIAPRVS